MDASRVTQPCECGCGANVPAQRYRCKLARFIAGHALHHGGKRLWTAAEDAHLRANYKQHSARELAAALNRSTEAVASRASKVLRLGKDGLHRSLAGWFEHHTPDRPADGCWEWKGSLTSVSARAKARYGQLGSGKGHWLAHRLSLFLANGRLPRSLDVLHRCDNTRCVNPAHLYLGQDSQNQRDRAERFRSPLQRLTPDDVRAIRAAFAAGATKDDLARQYGCHRTNIHALLSGRSWSWIASDGAEQARRGA